MLTVSKYSNLVFSLLNIGILDLDCLWRESAAETGQRVAEPNKWSIESFLRQRLMFPPRYIRLNLSSSDILQLWGSHLIFVTNRVRGEKPVGAETEHEKYTF